MKNRGFLSKYLGFPEVHDVFPAAIRSTTCVESEIACVRFRISFSIERHRTRGRSSVKKKGFLSKYFGFSQVHGVFPAASFH